MKEFKTLALVLRGQDVEKQIDSIYDREKMKFTEEVGAGLEELSYEANPSVLFLTNNEKKKPITDFIIETKYIKMYQDMKLSFNYLNGSVDFYEKMIQPHMKSEGDIQTNSFIEIKETQDLLDQSEPTALEAGKQSTAVCVIKPNQPFNVVLRSLKAIANLNPEGLTPKDPNFVEIVKIEFIENYTQEQIDFLFKHDILFDPHLSQKRKLRMKDDYAELFQSKPIWQIVLRGQNAISKLKGVIGRNPG